MIGVMQAEAGGGIAITGVGLVSPLGGSAWGTFRALLEGRTLGDRLDRAESGIDPVALVRGVGGVSSAHRAGNDPTVALGEMAGSEAIAMAGLSPAAMREMPLVIASSKGALEALMLPWTKAEAAALGPHGFLAQRLRARLACGETRVAVAACASSMAALAQGARMIRRGAAERVLVVATEASLLPILVHSYRRLGVLPPLTPQRYRGLPLSRGRNGFVLNEIGAAVLLDARPQRAAALGSLEGVAMLAEADDLIRSARPPAALDRLAGWAAERVSDDVVLHPHATGTMENDETELQRLGRALGGRADGAPVYAVKGALGHGLGASGLVSVVIAALGGVTKRLPPMPWLDGRFGPVIESPMRVSAAGATLRGREQHVVTAAGFGGHVGCAVLRA